MIYPGVQASCFEKHVFWPLPFYTWHCQHLLWKWRIRCSHEIDPTTKQILSWRLFTRERWVKVGMFWLILSRRVIDNQVWCAKDFCANICQLIRSCKNMLRAVKLWDAKHISLLCRYFQWAVVKLALSGERPAHHSSSSWLTNSTHTGSIRHKGAPPIKKNFFRPLPEKGGGRPHPPIFGTFFAGICLAGIPVLLRICLSTMSSDCHLRFCSYLLEGVSPQVEVPAEEHGGKCYKLLVSVLSSGPEEIRIILISILLPKIPDPWASNQRCGDCWQKIDHRPPIASVTAAGGGGVTTLAPTYPGRLTTLSAIMTPRPCQA